MGDSPLVELAAAKSKPLPLLNDIVFGVDVVAEITSYGEYTAF